MTDCEFAEVICVFDTPEHSNVSFLLYFLFFLVIFVCFCFLPYIRMSSAAFSEYECKKKKREKNEMKIEFGTLAFVLNAAALSNSIWQIWRANAYLRWTGRNFYASTFTSYGARSFALFLFELCVVDLRLSAKCSFGRDYDCCQVRTELQIFFLVF